MSTESSPTPAPQPGRRGFGPGTVVLVALVSAALGAGGLWLFVRPASGEGPANGGTEHAPTATKAEPKEQWICPMHPTIVQDHFGYCPICSMKLVKTTPSAVNEGAGTKGEHKDETERGDVSANGLATVSIDPSRQQLIGLKTAAVTRGTVGGTWRTVGRVAVDETRVRHINVKVSGFAEQVFVDFTGKAVRKGQPLFSIYSPELYAAQEEYLLALKTRNTLAEGGSLTLNGDDLLASARRKLELWDIPASELQRLERTGEVAKALTLYSPISGVVVKKDVVQGMRLEAGAMPYEIVDLSEVWVLADVYESELRHVKVGMPATLALKAFPNRLFQGKVVFIDPLLDPTTRTVKVRLTFPNPTGDLRPEMFGEVTLSSSAREGMRIPVDAVIDSGTRSVVFVALSEGRFQPREVKLGESDGSHVEVVEGLHESERVVTRANFLIDSESRLRSSLGSMGSGRGGTSGGGAEVPSGQAAEHSGHGGHPAP